jgi:hypothetical protein
MSTKLAYNALHQVVVCRHCKTFLVPGPSSIERHLRAAPHRLLGQALKAHLDHTDSLALRTVEELQRNRPANGSAPLEYLQVYGGYGCLLCNKDAFLTTHLPQMQHHMFSHKRKAKEHDVTPLWWEYRLQTYFTAKGQIDYFVVTDNEEKGGVPARASDSVLLTRPEKELFKKLKKDCKDIRRDLEEQASVRVHAGKYQWKLGVWHER